MRETHMHELAEVREGWQKVKETHKSEKNEAAILPVQSIVVSH